MKTLRVTKEIPKTINSYHSDSCLIDMMPKSDNIRIMGCSTGLHGKTGLRLFAFGLP
jgi:hypothetical protein